MRFQTIREMLIDLQIERLEAETAEQIARIDERIARYAAMMQ